MSILHAAMQKCRDCGSRSGGHAVRRKTWVLAAAAVLVAASRHRRRGRHVRREASGPGRTAAAGEHRAGGEEDALGHGLPGWDPDLSGAIGRLAVLRDQPGPRDIHQAARGRPGDLSGSRALPGERSARWCCCMARHPPIGPCRPGRPAPTWPSSTRIWSRSATPPAAQLSPTSASFGSATVTAVEKLQAAAGGDPDRHADAWSGGVRTHRRAGDDRVSAARGQRPARRDGDAGHLDHSPGAGGAGRLATDRRGGRGQGEHHPAQQPDHARVSSPRWGRSPPAHRARAGRVELELRRAGNGHLLLRQLGSTTRPSPWTSPRPTRPPRARGIRPRCRSASPPPACPTRWSCR